MSTKNLARTVIEGGRCNKWERRYSHAEARAHEKAYLSEVSQDVENWYDYDIEQLDPVGKCFRDKLGPMQRWLAAQCGRPWAEVRSDVAKTFDTRTTAGRHIVHDHLLRSVEETPDLRYRRYYYGPEDFTTSYSRYDFYVDGDGILREKTVIRRKEKVEHCNTHQVANWLNGRIVGFVGDKAYWFVPVGKSNKHRYGSSNRKWTTQWGWTKDRPYYYYNNSPLRFLFLEQVPVYKTDKDGNKILDEHRKGTIIDFKYEWKEGTPTFRQDRKLNDKEAGFWNSIPDRYRWIILEKSPTYVAPKGTKKVPYYY